MNTTQFPQSSEPFAPSQAAPARAAKPQRSTASTAILITTSIVGGLALIGTATSAAVGLVAPDPWEVVETGSFTTEYEPGPINDQLFADVTDVTAIEVDVVASSFTVKFGDVTQALLMVKGERQGQPDVMGSADGWTLERVDNELIVDRQTLGTDPNGESCLLNCGPVLSGNQEVTLVLPRTLGKDAAVSLDVNVSAGEFTGSGVFDEVDLNVQAGDVKFTGAARTLNLDVQLGDATVEAKDVENADISVATGNANVVLSGAAPQNTELDVKMGSLSVQLPKEEYKVLTHGSLGELDNRLAVSEESQHTVTVRLEAAEAVLS